MNISSVSKIEINWAHEKDIHTFLYVKLGNFLASQAMTRPYQKDSLHLEQEDLIVIDVEVEKQSGNV